MSNLNPEKFHSRQLISTALATVMLTSIFAVTSYSGTAPRSFNVDKTNAAAIRLAQPQTPVLRVNGKIAFASSAGNNYEIFVMNSDGSGRVQVTSNGFSNNPAFSPDGNRIAFYSSGGINRINADGSNQVFLTSASDNKMSWSPDGRKIAFTCNGICIVDSDGSNRMPISNDPRDSAPAWSPDGTKIAFASIRDGNSAIYVMNIDGSNPTRLTHNSLADYRPDWSPDGLKLAFTELDGCITIPNGEVLCFSSFIFVMNADGSNQTSLTGGSVFDSRNATTPSWSPDGTKLVFDGSRIASSTSRPELFAISANGGTRINLTNTADANESVPDWGPVPSVLSACPNPIDCAQFFVEQHYLDFLNREPDADGLAFWTNEIVSCSSDAQCIEVKRINVSAAFFLSIEFQETGYLVYKTYGAAFGTTRIGRTVPLTRAEFLPDVKRISQNVVVGAAGWQTLLEANKVAYFDEFVARADFIATYPTTMTAADYVDALNTNAGQVLSTLERGQLVADLTAGTKTRAQVLRAVSEDAKFTSAQFNRAFVLMQYFGYLQRNPYDSPDSNFDGYTLWLNKLNTFNGNFIQAEMVKAFITSLEYTQRFRQP